MRQSWTASVTTPALCVRRARASAAKRGHAQEGRTLPARASASACGEAWDAAWRAAWGGAWGGVWRAAWRAAWRVAWRAARRCSSQQLVSSEGAAASFWGAAASFAGAAKASSWVAAETCALLHRQRTGARQRSRLTASQTSVACGRTETAPGVPVALEVNGPACGAPPPAAAVQKLSVLPLRTHYC